MILVIALALILALLLWIAFVPLNIIVNTAQNRYHISQTGTVTLSWHPNEQSGFKIKVFGFYVNQQPKQRQRKASAKIQKSKRPQSRKSLDAWAFLFKGILTSFKLRRLEGTIDFDDVFLNALLYPVFFLSNGGATRISTNFHGEYMLDIFAQGRIYSMLWTTIRFYFTKK